MASAYLFFDPRARPLSVSGAIIPGAVLKFFLSTTLTPTPVYGDAALSVSLGTTVTAGPDGHFPPIYLSPAITYRVQMYDAGGLVLLPDGDVDPLCPRPDYPVGTVMWFHGTAAARDAAYPPAQWQTLNGTNGTPDGRDRLPMIAGGAYQSGDLGGGSGATVTGAAGAHTHGGVTGSTTLDASNMPQHNHRLFTWETGSQGNAESFGASGAHGVAGDNDHSFPGSYAYRDQTVDLQRLIEPTGSGAPAGHTHTITAAPDHTHTIAAILPPFVALWALMRRS